MQNFAKMFYLEGQYKGDLAAFLFQTGLKLNYGSIPLLVHKKINAFRTP